MCKIWANKWVESCLIWFSNQRFLFGLSSRWFGKISSQQPKQNIFVPPFSHLSFGLFNKHNLVSVNHNNVIILFPSLKASQAMFWLSITWFIDSLTSHKALSLALVSTIILLLWCYLWVFCLNVLPISSVIYKGEFLDTPLCHFQSWTFSYPLCFSGRLFYYCLWKCASNNFLLVFFSYYKRKEK